LRRPLPSKPFGASCVDHLTVTDSSSSIPPVNPWLSRFAKLVVLATFWLIFIGGHTTTSGAGMAFPDWPLSHGSVNPHGWWEDMMMRLEHGHRWTAGPVGILIGILCAWVWRSRWSVPLALASAFVSTIAIFSIANLFTVKKVAVVIASVAAIVISAIVFLVLLKRDARRDSQARPASVRWLAYWAFVGVCLQSILGGLRVIFDPEGIVPIDFGTATAFRVIHGCFAQTELCLLVALAAQLSPAWPSVRFAAHRPSRLAWTVVAVVFLQLIAGASMRHLGAGLAIPTFPQAAPDGSWMPVVHNAYVDLNFTHTRLGAVVVTVLVLALSLRTLLGSGRQPLLARPALGLLGLVLVQVTLGLYVIWLGRPAMLTTLHVVNGAAVLGTTVLLAVRLGRASKASTDLFQPHPHLLRATA
jgi:cytochrome c oxidase assembly protein subunit 15